ncbi:hypothetical protein D3C87_1411740 [compost metagenome]
MRDDPAIIAPSGASNVRSHLSSVSQRARQGCRLCVDRTGADPGVWHARRGQFRPRRPVHARRFLCGDVPPVPHPRDGHHRSHPALALGCAAGSARATRSGLVRRLRRRPGQLLSAGIDTDHHPHHAADRHWARARHHQALLQAPACRADPRDLRPRHCRPGSDQVRFRPQSHPAANADRPARRRRSGRVDRLPGQCHHLSALAPDLLPVLSDRHWWRVCLPAVHHLRHGGPCRHGRS